MKFRNLSPQQMFAAMADKHVPECRFPADHPERFQAWKTDALPRVLATLGKMPDPVDPNPELILEWTHDGLVKQRWLIDVGPDISAACVINYPGDLKKGEKRPAILCCHGHAQGGKNPIMGNLSEGALEIKNKMAIKAFGHEMAKQGFITYAIDWIGFGERGDDEKPHFRSQGNNRDWCNLLYLHATMLGMTSLGINVAHGKVATNFVSGLPHVDPERLGTMGRSGGGTMALWMTLCDERIKATEIICYSNLWADFGIRDINYCGMQVAPGLYQLVDLPDLQGLIAPRPLLVDIGANDNCFRPDSAVDCYKQVEAIYTAAGAGDHLELDLHSGGHAWGGNRAMEFFNRHLRG